MEHVVVVDGYHGRLEPTVPYDDGSAIGLPVASLVDLLRCEATVLRWDAWYAYERVPAAFTSWESLSPHTRLIRTPPSCSHSIEFNSPLIRTQSIAACDPESGHPFADGLSPRLRGLLAENDPLLLAAYCLREELTRIHRQRRIDLLIVPMWGGLGYLVQIDRAAEAGPLAEIPVGVVVTDTSANRWNANQEGRWTRPLIGRQQREELSLALADVAMVFGPRSRRIAERGRAPGSEAPVPAARHFSHALLERLRTAAALSREMSALSLCLDGPCMPAAGTLVTLDAVRMLRESGTALTRPIESSGIDTVFAPMRPKSFVGYWSSRAWVRELVEAGQWRWNATDPTDADGLRHGAVSTLRVRLQPSVFEHLSDLVDELAAGSLVVASPAALDGLLPGDRIPDLARLDPEAGPRTIAAQLQRLDRSAPTQLEELRRSMCDAALASASQADDVTRTLAMALRAAAENPPRRVSLGAVMQRQLDPRRPLATVDPPRLVMPTSRPEADTLTVVVPCHDAGPPLVECLRSIWASRRMPDELIVVDDGSREARTIDILIMLEEQAAREVLPFTLLRQPNRGLAAARNAGLAATRSTCVSFLDGDDLVEPEFYGLALSLLAREPALGAVGAWAELFGDMVGFWNAPQPELPLLLVENQVIVPAVMRTSLLRELGGYTTEQRYNYEDWDLSLRLLGRGFPIVTIPRYLQRYRVRSESLYRTMTDAQNQVMRERLLTEHCATVRRFAVEVALQLEHRLAATRFAAAQPAAAAESENAPRAVRSAARRLARFIRRHDLERAG